MTTYFLGLGADDTVRARTVELTNELRAAVPDGVRWVDPAGLHITVRYFGAVEDVEPLLEVLPAVVAAQPPFELAISGLGAFPDTVEPAVLWAGVGEGRDSLFALHAAIEAEVWGLGFDADRRSFSPHLTLGFVNRDVEPDQVATIGDVVGAILQQEAILYGRLPVQHVTLYASNPGPTGSVFTSLAQFPLG